jgi:putative oxidoreductase
MPIAASTLSAVMMTAIKRVHLQNGPWVTKGGYEYPLVVTAVLLGLVEIGPGKLSVDCLVGSKRSGAGWAAMAFGGGALAAYTVEAIAERNLPSPIAWLEDHRPGSHEHVAA